jgi:hypothetical protein
MVEPSGDEVLLLIVSGLIAVGTSIGWLTTLLRPWRLRRTIPRSLLVIAPPAAWIGLLAVLRTLTSADVRNEPFYLVQYLLLGIAWCGIAASCLPLIGLSVRDDLAERDNRAAVPGVVGALLGLMACYAGANIGDGPGWWCVVWAAGLATVAWFVAGALVASFARLPERVTVERDEAAGVRLAAFFIACGILCGRGAAGDWSGALATVLEFAAAWPVVPLLAVAISAERLLRTSPERPESSWAGTAVVVLLETAVVVGGLFLVGPPADGYVFPGQGIER